MRLTTSSSSAVTGFELSCFIAATSSSSTTGVLHSRYSFKDWRIVGITSDHSVSEVLVSVTKLLAINTALMKGNPKSSVARGDTFALATSARSMLLPGYKSLLATNFIVSGLGVISVYILITGLPVLIITHLFS